ncbi:ABC-type multidrug transport system ATPase subunit [Janthinobacterium sp. CG_23.3]|uniref:ABC transporter ATP-binding protein n=1 Tax=Janthinobacterium sp. CG_23.3 TaxID=3349634 RepID=UPI0038D3941C
MRFSYPERELFAHWSAAIAPGVTLVRGGDGRGKSTLLRLFAGAQAADAGQLQINDVRLEDQPAAYRRQVFWVDPRSDAFEKITVLDYFKSLPGLYPQFDAQALPALIEGLSLGPHLEKFFYMLSTGSKRKVWLAAAFASGTPLALLDEPFAGLDKVSINFVLALLTQAAQGARAWVLADYQAPGDVPLAATIDLGD